MYNENFACNKKYSKEKICMIVNYYCELYNNYEMKTIPDMADELEISATSLRNYIEMMYNGKNINGKYSKISLMILLCTKFKSTSQYFDAQQELSSIIKKREIVKLLKEHEAKQKNKHI